MKIQIADKLLPIWTEHKRYNFLRGGRGSGKSWGVAQRIVALCAENPDLNVVCIREVQKSIQHSSKKLIEQTIRQLHLEHLFRITRNEIRSVNGSGVMIFQGLQSHTADSIKSLEGFHVCWVEEAQSISAYSLELLIPTIRHDQSRFYFTWNPRYDDDPIEQLREMHVKDAIDVFINYNDNPFCPEVIKEEAEKLKAHNPSKYRHIYLGGFADREGVIYDNWEEDIIHDVSDFDHICGLDWGYSNDPTAFVSLYVDTDRRVIYVDSGFYETNLQNDRIASKIKALGEHKSLIFADSAEPKSIDALKRFGIARVRPSIKGSGSILSGIDFVQTFRIVVNPNLDWVIDELKRYRWDVDKHTGKPLNKPIDDYNHALDAIRYAVTGKYVKAPGKVSGGLKEMRW